MRIKLTLQWSESAGRVAPEGCVSRTLLKNIVLWGGSPPRSAGVPNLFGVSPQRDQFADQNAPNELGSPTENAFFNRIIEAKRFGETRSLGFDTLFATLRSTQPAVAGPNLMRMGRDAPW